MSPYRPARMVVGKWGRELDYNLFTTSEADRIAFCRAWCRYAFCGLAMRSLLLQSLVISAWPMARPRSRWASRIFQWTSSACVLPNCEPKPGPPKFPDFSALRARSIQSSTIGSAGKIRQLEGGEYSAWGISSEVGGVLVLYAPGHGPIADTGLRAGDLIYSCGGVPVKNAEELSRCIEAAPVDQPLTILIRRDDKVGVKVVFPARPQLPQVSQPSTNK